MKKVIGSLMNRKKKCWNLYHKDLSQQQTADVMLFSLSHIKQVNASLIDKMKQLLT